MIFQLHKIVIKVCKLPKSSLKFFFPSTTIVAELIVRESMHWREAEEG